MAYELVESVREFMLHQDDPVRNEIQPKHGILVAGKNM